MAPRYRNILQEKLELHAPAFRMTDITFKSFQLQVCRRWCRCRCRHKPHQRGVSLQPLSGLPAQASAPC
jgi:hypothetical protein